MSLSRPDVLVYFCYTISVELRATANFFFTSSFSLSLCQCELGSAFYSICSFSFQCGAHENALQWIYFHLDFICFELGLSSSRSALVAVDDDSDDDDKKERNKNTVCAGNFIALYSHFCGCRLRFQVVNCQTIGGFKLLSRQFTV